MTRIKQTGQITPSFQQTLRSRAPQVILASALFLSCAVGGNIPAAKADPKSNHKGVSGYSFNVQDSPDNFAVDNFKLHVGGRFVPTDEAKSQIRENQKQQDGTSGSFFERHLTRQKPEVKQASELHNCTIKRLEAETARLEAETTRLEAETSQIRSSAANANMLTDLIFYTSGVILPFLIRLMW
jgi:ABC-type phosphate transport system auxiliary subunit